MKEQSLRNEWAWNPNVYLRKGVTKNLPNLSSLLLILTARKNVYWNLLMLIFLSCPKLHFSTSSESLVILWKRSKSLFWLVLVHFGVVDYSNLLNVGQRIRVTWKRWLTLLVLEYESLWQVLVSIWLFRTNSDWHRCSNSKSVDHISDHGFKCLLGFVILTDKSKCVAKFMFASAWKDFRRSLKYSRQEANWLAAGGKNCGRVHFQSVRESYGGRTF